MNAANDRAIAMMSQESGGIATNGAAGFARIGPAAVATYTDSEITGMSIIIP